jgi:hypothetical protein
MKPSKGLKAPIAIFSASKIVAQSTSIVGSSLGAKDLLINILFTSLLPCGSK